MKKIFFVMLAAVLLAGCHSRQNEAIMKRSSSGKTLEVLLAADRGLYNGATKVLIDSIFRQAQEGLPQPEARFDVVNVPVSSLRNTQMFQMHRNIIIFHSSNNFHKRNYIFLRFRFSFMHIYYV